MVILILVKEYYTCISSCTKVADRYQIAGSRVMLKGKNNNGLMVREGGRKPVIPCPPTGTS